MKNARLSNEEIEACREAFQKFDRDGSGAIDRFELRAALQAMGQDPSEDEVYDLIQQVDADGSGEVSFAELLALMAAQKEKMVNASDDSDTVDAFVALGGGADKSGEISTERLRKVVRDFGLTIEIDAMIAEADQDNSGLIDYDEFKEMMK